MSERDNEYFQQFIGTKIGPDKYRIKGKKLSAYAKAIGDLDPKYYVEPPTEEGVKADYSKIVAHPAFAATYTVPGVLMSLPEVVDNTGAKLIKNIGKSLQHHRNCQQNSIVIFLPGYIHVFKININAFI